MVSAVGQGAAARLSRLKNWPLQYPKPVLARLSRLKISCDN